MSDTHSINPLALGMRLLTGWKAMLSSRLCEGRFIFQAIFLGKALAE